jgi:RNA polymerase sigma-70 factor (ECF subfamily)
MDPESSFELIRLAQGGDSEALSRLLERYRPRLHRWASGRLPRFARDLTDTQDLVQDALIRTLRNFDRFDDRGEGALQAYLRQAVMNRIRDEVRRHERLPRRDELSESLADRAVSPLEQAIGGEAIERYETALAALEPADREAVIARIELGCSYQEIAVLGDRPSADAARVAVARALTKLARIMSDLGAHTHRGDAHRGPA